MPSESSPRIGGPDSWANLGEKYAPWALVLSCYAAVALAAYLALRYTERRGGSGGPRRRSAATPPENESVPTLQG